MKNDTLTIKYIESEMEFNDTLTRFDAIYSGKVNESIVKKMSLNPSIKVRLIGNEKVSGFLAYEVVFSDGVYSLFVHGLYCGREKVFSKAMRRYSVGDSQAGILHRNCYTNK